MNAPFLFRKLDSWEQLEEAFRLRFHVYCREKKFLNEIDYPEGVESDAFDEHAVHFGAFDLLGQMVGTVRLILPTCEKFPIEHRCQELEVKPSSLGHGQCAEISRLAISKSMKKKIPYGLFLSDEPEINRGVLFHRISFIVIGLCRLMYQECQSLGINYCMALMEKTLWSLLKLHGFSFEPIGPEVDCYGTVTPYLINVPENEKKGAFRLPSVIQQQHHSQENPTLLS